MRPTGMPKPVTKEGAKTKAPVPPPVLTKHATTVTVVNGGSRSRMSSSSSSSSLTSPLESRLSGEFSQILNDSGRGKVNQAGVQRVQVGGTKKKAPAPPPPVSPRDKRAPPPPSVKASPSPRPPHAKPKAPSRTASAPVILSTPAKSPPPVLPRCSSGGTSLSSPTDVAAKPNAKPNGHHHQQSLSGSSDDGKSMDGQYEDDFLSSLPSLPADDVVASSLQSLQAFTPTTTNSQETLNTSWSSSSSLSSDRSVPQKIEVTPRSPTVIVIKKGKAPSVVSSSPSSPTSPPKTPEPAAAPSDLSTPRTSSAAPSGLATPRTSSAALSGLATPRTSSAVSSTSSLTSINENESSSVNRQEEGEGNGESRERAIESGEVETEESGSKSISISPLAASEQMPPEVFYVNMMARNGVSVDVKEPSVVWEATFAGRRDVRNSESLQEKRIVSSKGTVRGFKNRVRAGIVTFVDQSTNKFNYRVLEKDKIVVYTTSVTVVRETHERCKTCRNMLQNHMVRYEERDLYMSLEHQGELRDRMDLADSPHVELTLPQVFMDGIHIGGAVELEKLNESGELRKILENFPKIQVRTMCDNCGGYRFVPCVVCHGSKKSVRRNHFTEEFCALRCMHCNENGLQRCQDCLDQQE